MNTALLTTLPKPAPDASVIIVTLTPAQRHNLLGFLQRAQLSGKEVAAYSEVFSIIQRAAPMKPPGGTPGGATGTVALP